MNSFDRAILTWLNQYARHFRAFDLGVSWLASYDFFKGVVILLLAWLWFKEADDRRRRREIILATGLAAIVAITAGRLLALGLPFRVRPAHNPDLHFVTPYGLSEAMLRGWSAFPSDHAMLFGSVATGICFVSLRLGLATHAYIFLVILAARLYTGLHHPTDVVAGLLIGVAIGAGANVPRVRGFLVRRLMLWHDRSPQAFYMLATFAAIQMATMFIEVRRVVAGVQRMIHPPAAKVQRRPAPVPTCAPCVPTCAPCVPTCAPSVTVAASAPNAPRD